ncbi:YtpI family protein [Sutcliffiella halmapala]|uniref:YtpI family protein n=1 Tax=Sutcliffiella halmapala TaxID=79882 RepID=UPI000994CBFF|nr:YtpI family protein [Sutcliffiella halmapala]
MAIFIFMIIFSLIFYMLYKVKYFRTHLPVEKKWLSAKSSMALGSFVFFFGVNTVINPLSTVAIVVGIVLILIGLGSFLAGLKAYRYYLPYAIKEAEAVKEQEMKEKTVTN